MHKVLATLRANFAPLKLPNFRLYLGGQAVSMIGSWLQSTAQAWVVWELTGSEAALGNVVMLNTLPLLLFGPWAGVWADRLNRRVVLIGAAFSAMLLAFTLAILVQTDSVQIWHVYVLAFLLGCVNALDFPAQQAFLGDLTGMAEVRKAVNLNAMIIQISRMLGPAIAGIVVARIGSAPAFWLNGVSFLAVIASLIMVRASQIRAPSEHVNPMRQLLDGLQYVREHPRVQDMFLISAIFTFCAMSIIFSLLPSVADRVLGGGAETLGALMSASGAGALVSVLLIVPLTQAYKRPGRILTGAMLWSGTWLMVFGFSTWMPLSWVSLFLASMGAPIIFTMTLGLTQLMAPSSMRARLLSLFTMISFGLQPVAALAIGHAAETFGVQNTIEFNAVMLLTLAVAIILLRPALRRWEPETNPAQETTAMPVPAVVAVETV
jgi:MFS family permease